MSESEKLFEKEVVFASGPDGWFITKTARFANKIIADAGYDRDDWTVTKIRDNGIDEIL